MTRRLIGKRQVKWAVGDRIWIKEAFKTSEYSCGEEPTDDSHECSAHCRQTYVYYRSTPRVGYRPFPDQARVVYLDESSELTDWYKSGFKSPLYMPRWASRLTLDVTGVRAEHLHDMPKADVYAEGITEEYVGHFREWYGSQAPWMAFAAKWNEINGHRDPWESNPLVLAITFRRIDA